MKKRLHDYNFKIKTGYYLKLLTPDTKKLLGRTKSKITKEKNAGKAPHLEITEVVLIHFVNDDYQRGSRVFLYIFLSKQIFGKLLDVSLKHFTFLKTFN